MIDQIHEVVPELQLLGAGHFHDEMLDQVGLLDVRDRMANKLSGGMKRRLGIAQALIGNPRLLVIDEPTTGLDPEERIRFRNILSDLSQKDVTIIRLFNLQNKYGGNRRTEINF